MAVEPNEAAAELALIDRLCNAARAATLKHFRTTDLEIEGKRADAFDPVTAADRDAETAMRAILAVERPSDGVLGEEHGETAGSSGRVWVLDPIDGTRAFVAGLPTWGVLVALNIDGRAEIGAIDQPFIGERFTGVRGGAARGALWRRDGWADAQLRTRRAAALAEATLLTTSPALFEGADLAAYQRVERAVRLPRYGLDCYGYAMVAAGHADLVIEAGLAPYDIQAAIPVIEGAGGVVTDWSGGPAEPGGRVVAAANAEIHAAAMALLAL